MGTHTIDIIQVEFIQRRAAKVIGNSRQLPYGERLRRLKLPSLVYRRKRDDMMYVYKVVHQSVRIEINCFFYDGR